MSNADNHHYMDVAEEALHEVLRARANLFGPMKSAHEGYAVLLEEVDELWDEVKGHCSLENTARMRKEAIQVAAMAIAFVVEVCDAS